MLSELFIKFIVARFEETWNTKYIIRFSSDPNKL